jgi:3'(2'),5'-bisphosphate nucleotidase
MTLATPELVEGCVSAALDAGRVILDVYARPIDVTLKADLTPVTEADGAAERLILDALARLAPEVPVVAEESVAAGDIPETGGAFFLVDPLDGTREFIDRNGEFTVNIALIEGGVPVLGVVYAPALGHIAAGSPAGAFAGEVDAGKARTLRRIATRTVPEAGPVVVGSRSHGTPATDAYIATLGPCSWRAIGSSLKFCLLASGEADVYPRFGPTMEWDTAAGDAVLRAAGGVVTTVDGVPLRYGKRGRAGIADFLNPDFIALGRRID